jgi:hypothetical protein
MKRRTYFSGDRVVVRSPEEILATLDSDGTLDGLPFMPEMLEWCGKTFRVQRRVEKTCVDAEVHLDPKRRFPARDVVMLDDLRCDGAAHDGCKRGCRVFWKEAWLRPQDGPNAAAEPSDAALAELRARLKTKADEKRYSCQSTELLKATETFPGRQKLWSIRVALREIINRDHSVFDVLRFSRLWFMQRLRRRLAGDSWLRGPHKKTPHQTLGLQAGESVRVKSRDEIIATLDAKRRNRGMGICDEVLRCCGGEAEVRYRVDRIIDERTGMMREITDTVGLLPIRNRGSLGEECLCYDELGDCPRGELMYWREIWLERVNRD